MNYILSYECKGFNATRRTKVQNYISQCQNQNIDIEVECIKTTARGRQGGTWGTLVTNNTGRTNFRIHCAKDFDNNYDPCSYFRDFGLNKRTYLVWCENCISYP